MSREPSPKIRQRTGSRMKCPRCGSKVILHRDGITCQRHDCASGVMLPPALNLGQYEMTDLRQAWPELRSDCPNDTVALDLVRSITR